jgi:uncharacterized protein
MQNATTVSVPEHNVDPLLRIRPHHLLCVLTFAGNGYSPEFVANFQRIANLIASGSHTLEIVFGPDDICSTILADPECHCRNAGVLDRDRLAVEALTTLLPSPIEEHSRLQLDPDTLNQLRTAFKTGSIRKACHGCQWSPLCDSVAKDSFSETTLLRSHC